MALPRTISSTLVFPRRNYFLGPVRDSNGNHYVVLRGPTEGVDAWPHVYKADNGDAAWSEVDSANYPQDSSWEEHRSFWVYPDSGDILHIYVHDKPTGDTIYHTFHMSGAASNPDTWQTKNEVIFNVAQTLTSAISGIVRSDGDRVTVYQGDREAIKGTEYGRIGYAYNEGAGWTTGAVDDGGATDFRASIAVLGASDKTHFFYKDDTNSNLLHKAFTSGNVLDVTPDTVNDTAVDANDYVIAPGVYYDASGTARITIAWRKSSDSKVYTSEIDDDGTPSAEENASDNTVEVGATYEEILACLAVDADTDTVYLVYANDADQDLYIDDNINSGGWGSDTEILDAVTVNAFSANIYQIDNSDTVLAYVYDDGGTIKYNEYVIVAAGAGFSWPSKLRHPSTNVLLRL